MLLGTDSSSPQLKKLNERPDSAIGASYQPRKKRSELANTHVQISSSSNSSSSRRATGSKKKSQDVHDTKKKKRKKGIDVAVVPVPRKRRTFEERFAELVSFKTKHGHCHAPHNPSNEYYSLGKWCNNVRYTRKQIQKGKSPRRSLSPDQIGKLEALGFGWSR